MNYQYRKVNTDKITGAQIDALLADGWEAVGYLEDKKDAEGNVLVSKSHILRFRKPHVQPSGDNTVLTPDKIIKKLNLKMK